MVRNQFKIFALTAAAVGTLASATAMASDYTDVLDAADQVYLENEEGQIVLVDDVFDISLNATFNQRLEWAKLKREYQDPNLKRTRELNELDYKRITNTIDLDLEIGLFHDLSLNVSMPIVISDQRQYRFDSTDVWEYDADGQNRHKTGEVTSASKDSYFAGNTRAGYDVHDTAYDAGGTQYKFFDLQDNTWLKGKKRSGIGDMTFGIHWNPYNTERNYIPDRPWRDETGRSTMLLAFDYTAPISEAANTENKKVGSGVHELKFTFAASHRFKYVDPYIGVIFGLPIDRESDYHDYGSNQPRKGPGMWGRADLGAEFIPYEHMHTDFQRFVKFDLGLFFRYNSEGRAYSELGDAFATSDCYKTNLTNGVADNPKCQWVAEKWGSGGSANVDKLASGNYSGSVMDDGFYDYDGYGVLGASLKMVIQPVQYVQILAGASFDYTQDHFITFTKPGRDTICTVQTGDKADKCTNLKKDGSVDLSRVEERNPTYNGVLDAPGRRIKRAESFGLDWFVGLKVMY